MIDRLEEMIRAAGGIVTHNAADREQIALVHRPKYDDWALPKGKLQPGEDWLVAAKREVEEELQCTVEVGAFAGSLYYLAAGVPKLVLYWHMRLVALDQFTANDEIDKITWLSFPDVLDRLSYQSERGLLKDVWAAL